MNNFLDKIPLESPIDKYSYIMDKKLSNKSTYDYYDYVEKIDPNYVTSLVFEDFKFRFHSQLNILAEVYGRQGCGKSIFTQDMAYRTGEIYQLPFNMEEHTLADFDLLDVVLHDTPFRTTFIVDEQPSSMFGYGSSRVTKNLKDYEEICRYTQKNLFYVAPSDRDHQSYYIFREDQRPSVERFRNQECLDCPRQSKCSIVSEKTKFNTLCGMPFWKRHGYPVAFNFMLITARRTDNHLLPRGYVRLPVLPPNLMQKYDVIKRRNIGIFERKESLGWVQQRKELREFQEKFRDRLVDEKGRLVSKPLMKAYLMDYFGERSFTTAEFEIFCAIIKSEINSPSFVDSVQRELKEEKEFHNFD